MRSPRLVIVLVAALALGAGGAPRGQTVTGPRPLTGRWAGDRIRLDAQPTGARLQVDCFLATLDVPVTPDATGAFTLTVTFVPFRGVAPEGEETHPKSTIKGRVDTDGLRLTIEPEGAEFAGQFTLARNGPAKLPNCRVRS